MISGVAITLKVIQITNIAICVVLLTKGLFVLVAALQSPDCL